MTVLDLGPEHLPELSTFLKHEPEINLYSLDVLENRSMSPLSLDEWRGVFDGGKLIAASLAVGRYKEGMAANLLTPFGDRDACRTLGAFEADLGGAKNLLGPTEASLAMLEGLGSPVCRLNDSENLFVCRSKPRPMTYLSLRPAVREETDIIEAMSAEMQLEDIGLDPRTVDPESHHYGVVARIASGRTLVGRQKGRICFMIDIGTRCKAGSQVGGTYVPPEFRGQGWGTQGMRGCAAYLLGGISEMVTLLVRESNTPAIKTYHRAGFEPYALFRRIEISGE